MHALTALFEEHGHLAVFLGVLFEQMGAPVPALPFLLLAGARSTGDVGITLQFLLLASSASVVADLAWFAVGRRHAETVLGRLCRGSTAPHRCRACGQTRFARWGSAAVLLAKFVPGLTTVARPLAGALGMPARTFLALDLVGTLVWATGGIGSGILFDQEIAQVLLGLERAEEMIVRCSLLAVALYGAGRAGRALLRRARVGAAEPGPGRHAGPRARRHHSA
ncbi:DedA family protein [Ramlibacter alkalitolerans]|uniref:DedA family protein n=1 Tax=Ramlibacter alkalitolerans TaxID=2039631 RepID=A0ABS1JTD0_9BURK|nr:DedA family protein [Ramlibacter alkalitolerans]MBL0427498.1 DedA family protein [Ramlibacter alkalitolerans]